ncbi:AP-3 complex subunit delta [Platanthera zijinensis]|uniref:AP-3 complex subunit delta n=1 Tax=Platanthera zijinensis TaxID=2320716 RepID=A0AAP0G5G2_9ASPA
MDFDWYVSLLAEMVRNPHFMKGEEVERQLVDIALRVKEARPELVRVARDLLIDPALLENPFLHRVHSAVAWISGEFIKFSRNPMEIVEALLQPRTSFLPSLVRAVYVQAVFKVVSFCFISFMNVGIISDSKVILIRILMLQARMILMKPVNHGGEGIFFHPISKPSNIYNLILKEFHQYQNVKFSVQYFHIHYIKF